jgi:hypothetical protein
MPNMLAAGIAIGAAAMAGLLAAAALLVTRHRRQKRQVEQRHALGDLDSKWPGEGVEDVAAAFGGGGEGGGTEKLVAKLLSEAPMPQVCQAHSRSGCQLAWMRVTATPTSHTAARVNSSPEEQRSIARSCNAYSKPATL